MAGKNGKRKARTVSASDIDIDADIDEEIDGGDNVESDDDVEVDTDNVGEASVEIDVNALMAEMEAEGLSTDHLKGMSSRKRLEEIMEQRRMERELLDFDSFDVDGVDLD